MKTPLTLPCLLIISCWAHLSPLVGQQAKEQRADTLRRELTVMTEETPQLGTRTPRDLSVQLLAPTVTPTRYTYLDTPIPFVLRPQLAPLSALGELQAGWERPRQRGYAFLAGGLAFGAKAGAGVTLLDTERSHWDLLGRFQLGDMKVASDQPYAQHLKAQRWELGSSFRQRFDEGTMYLNARGGQTMHNFYGRAFTLPLLSPGAGTVALAPELRQRSSLFTFAGSYTSLEDASQAWLYSVGLQLGYTQRRFFAPSGDTRQRSTEVLPELTADLSRRLSSTLRLGLDGAWSLSSLSSSSPLRYGFPEERTASTRMLLSLSPYLLLDDASGDLAWRVQGGLRFLTGGDHEKTHLVLFPRIEAKLRVGESFYAGVQTDAALLRHSLRQLGEDAPYLAPEAFPSRYDRLYTGKLTIGATLAKKLSAEVFLAYEDHRGATAYRPMAEALPLGSDPLTSYLTPLSFLPYPYNYQAQRLGVEVSYRHRGSFSLAARGSFGSYQTSIPLKPLPTFTLETLMELQPLSQLTLRAGYNFQSALQSYDLEGVVQRLQAGHRLHADLVYRLTKRLHLTAELRAPLQSAPTRWWGYAEAPLELFGGLQLTF